MIALAEVITENEMGNLLSFYIFFHIFPSNIQVSFVSILLIIVHLGAKSNLI